MDMLLEFLKTPTKDLDMAGRVAIARDIAAGAQKKGLTFKDTYRFIENMQDVFKRAEWRLKDDAFHAMEGEKVVHTVDDYETTY